MESLILTGDFLNVRHTDVFPFYCACCFVGLLRAKKNDKNKNKTEAPTIYARTSKKPIHFHKMFGIPPIIQF